MTNDLFTIQYRTQGLWRTFAANLTEAKAAEAEGMLARAGFETRILAV